MSNKMLEELKEEIAKENKKGNVDKNKYPYNIAVSRAVLNKLGLNLVKTNDTNKIYIYMYSKPTKEKFYRNIEQRGEIAVNEEDINNFEQENTVIYWNEQNDLTPLAKYCKIQAEFFEKATKTNQEEAKKYIINRYAKKRM
ncbi:MAG: hypothetical protein IJ565_05020 [Bacilli bacterium]|nr:hypothetical protein [Bacilli bacterium]